MSLTTLFGKLQEHELELDRLEKKNEGSEHKVRSLVLNTKVKKNDSEREEESHSDSDEDDSLIKKKVLKEGNDKRNESERSTKK